MIFSSSSSGRGMNYGNFDIQVKEDIGLNEIQLAERIGRGNFGTL